MSAWADGDDELQRYKEGIDRYVSLLASVTETDPTVDPGEREEEEPEFGPHDCSEEEVDETTSYPTRSGRITVTGRCHVCGSVRYSYLDSIL